MPNAGAVTEPNENVPVPILIAPSERALTFDPTLSCVIVPCGEATGKETRAADAVVVATKQPKRTPNAASTREKQRGEREGHTPGYELIVGFLWRTRDPNQRNGNASGPLCRVAH